MDRGLQDLQAQHQRIEAQFGKDFVTYDEAAAEDTFHMPQDDTQAHADTVAGADTEEQVETQPVDIRHYCLDKIRKLLDPESGCSEALLPIQFLQLFTREEITALEAAGIVLSGVSEEQPEGGIFIKHLLVSSLGLTPEKVRERTIDRIYATNVFRGVVEPVSRAPSERIPDPLQGLYRIPTDTICAAVCRDGKWTQSYAIPDGKWLVEGFDTTANQYAQEAFEGMVASDNNGEVTLFRPLENAKRFIKSCLRVGMPPVSVNQFMEAVKNAVRLNRKFIPPNGKLYIRPFMIGLQGGTGVKPAAQYLFAVEVTPYGEYLPVAASTDGQAQGIDIKSVTHKRHHSGKDKVGANYSDVFIPKKEAKDQGYSDILLLNPGGNVQECASSNFFLVERTERGFIVKTPTLRENILPGVTRDSLLELLRDKGLSDRLGANVLAVVDDNFLPEKDIEKAGGAFMSGTAAGVTNIKSITMTGGKQISLSDRETQEFITKLKALLQDARRGKLLSYEHWAVKIA